MVDPAYTSAEGRWQFAPDLGWSVHEAAVLCIGRKALGYRRRLRRRRWGRVGALRASLGAEGQRRSDEAKRWASPERGCPQEGPGRANAAGCRRMEAMPGDERLLRSDALGEEALAALGSRGFARWRKRRGERDGPWAALVMVQRARWGRAL